MDLKSIVLTLFLIILLAVSVISEEYHIGYNDILEIRFWPDQNLNSMVTVNQEGMITVDIIGQIQASGKTTQQLQDEIVRRMSRLNTKISQAVVRVVEYNYQHIFIKGQINQPGKISFEQIPDLWTVINEAGGITEFGDLTRVTIIKGGDKAGEILVVNVVDAIEKGEVDKLPKLERQDTIEIPRTRIGLPADDLGENTTAGKNVIYVIGAVNSPGPIKFEKNLDVFDVLSLAGGPTAEADMKKAKILTKDGFYHQTLQLNLEKYAAKNTIPRYFLKDEDTFILPTKDGPFMGLSVGTVAQILGVVTSAILIYDQVKPD